MHGDNCFLARKASLVSERVSRFVLLMPRRVAERERISVVASVFVIVVHLSLSLAVDQSTSAFDDLIR